MTLILSDKDVRGLADMPTLVDALEHGLREEATGPGAILPERMNLALGLTLFRVMPAILPASGVLGLKFFYGTLSEGVRYSVMVSAIDGGEVLAVVDAAYLTALRTGATSGVATRYLASPDARTVGLIGSGMEAETNLAAVCAVRPIETVRVYSRNPARRSDFARRMSARFGIAIEPVDTPEQAVAGTDVVVVATNTGRGGDVAFRGEWLTAGQHVVSIGSTATFLREIDENTFLRPEVVVFDAAPAQVGAESGDVVALIAEHPGWEPHGILDDVLAGRLARTDPGQITLFKSVGTAAQDLIGALALYRSASARGVGLVVPELAEPKAF
ncbi:ornithine cyclodeaminase family protein [Streptosporangium sp. NBC_01755]|uniref:ornithine cyclodeaminase family protein n=1 Tax=unclassified Streptosporangium TaxID=2632669 RepID=UPI002DDC0242|nr:MULTISPECIES: ornithine cyclodeaminase family protein [unclassified Streptosporangium]WSA24632.1 ornithine cyclodeaminase family protein [Streptosporangium sp. NBC_01810]WSC97292.1 ornithine cyclodeaminase family protein [Streptosporangium sp. NBC_01755]